MLKLAVAAAVLAGGTVVAADPPIFRPDSRDSQHQGEGKGQQKSQERRQDPQAKREAVTEHREGKARWKDCVQAAVDAAEAVDVLDQCGMKPHPPGRALGWDAAKVSKGAQHRVDEAAGVGKQSEPEDEAEENEPPED